MVFAFLLHMIYHLWVLLRKLQRRTACDCSLQKGKQSWYFTLRKRSERGSAVDGAPRRWATAIFTAKGAVIRRRAASGGCAIHPSGSCGEPGGMDVGPEHVVRTGAASAAEQGSCLRSFRRYRILVAMRAQVATTVAMCCPMPRQHGLSCLRHALSGLPRPIPHSSRGQSQVVGIKLRARGRCRLPWHLRNHKRWSHK
jgi:hypothetical protein